MKTFQAPYTNNRDVADLANEVAQAAGRADPFAELQYQHAEPARVRKGMLVLADGTDFNPGSGAGLYRRNEANDAWIFIG